MKSWAIIAAATVSSAVLWHFGTGLQPLAGLAVLAPIPVLLIAPRVSAGIAFLVGALSRLGGELQLWSYFVDTLEQPAPVTALLLGGTAVAFGAAVVLTRALLVRGRMTLAALALPAVWVVLEYLLAVLGPFGAWWSIAYTQADVLPLIQTAALTGLWGITFLILLVPATIGVLTAPRATRVQRLRVGGGVAVLLLAVAAFGWSRSVVPQDPDSTRVGLLAVSQPEDYVPVDTPEGRDMIERAAREIERLADHGAQVVVLPEKAWRADEYTLPLLAEPLVELAHRRGIHIIAGLVLTRAGDSVNAAIEYPSGVVYAKHYLIPGLEDELRPGTEWQRVPGTPWALAVCFDLDRPSLVRENVRRGAELLLVPALDFTDDTWLHSRMAVLRGVESGVGVARAPQLGQLVASDDRGRVLGTERTGVTVTRSVVASIPRPVGRTLYARCGDWFAWTSAVLCAVTVAGVVRRRSIS
ncbi:nitrilase-related carbon-nitrogen hydrolase [Nocardia xishanensis]|uniref:nitrilase-related carbon-nitrogen hydrolase n=1 Tax=Nocardia xishanensis TaxID=238964 RepID=UPI0033E925CD